MRSSLRSFKRSEGRAGAIERRPLAGRDTAAEVSAVVTTIGEPTFARALTSVAAQQPPLAEAVVVRDVAPFSRALNLGAAKVGTPYFLQVDSDMVLDADCVVRLRREVADDVGVVIGQLRDRLMGQVRGVKLFRTACFAETSMPDSVAPDTDFVNELARRGWRTVYVLDPADDTGVRHPTFGSHLPSYSPEYTFQKYRIEGRRHRHRCRPGGFRWQFEILEQSLHPCALIAQVGVAHGVFLRADEDLLGPFGPDPEFARLETFLAGRGRLAAPGPGAPEADEDRSVLFTRFHDLGRALSAAGAAQQFRELTVTLRAGGRNDAQRIAKVALCHGLFADTDDADRVAADLRLLDGLVPAASGTARRRGEATA
jgi:hypothetical protein